MEEYKFGKCTYCGKDKPLRDGICVDCNKNVDLPDFFKDLFKGTKNGL